MKSLGIPQPGAWLVINGYYTTVPLPEPTDYCGPVLIYAMPTPISPETYEQFLAGCRQLQVTSRPRISDFDLGGFLGRAKLVGCETSDAGQPLGIIEHADELGFVASSGRLGLFDVNRDPFPISDLPRANYDLSAPSENYTYQEPGTKGAAKSLGSHFADGFERQLQRELEKNVKGLGREVAKGFLEYGTDTLMGWLGGGGKPKGGGKRKR